MQETFVGDLPESTLSPQHELELKIVKIQSLVANVQKRIELHEGRLAKLYQSDEQTKAKDSIRRLTQRILANS